MKNFKILDLFCGAGGFSAGLDSLDIFETVIGLDFNKDALSTFDYNFPNATGIYGDITNKDIRSKVVTLAKQKGVNMIIGGPPCQGFSSKGKNLGMDDPRNFLFREYLSFVAELKPDIFIIENVKNLLTAVDGFFIKQIESEIKRIGYELDYGVLNASNFGVPQSRQRAIIVGSKIGKIKLPKQTESKLTTVKDAIGDLAYLESGQGVFETIYTTTATSTYQKLMRKNSTQLVNHIATNHKAIALEKLAMIPPGGSKADLPIDLHGKQQFKTTWGRLKWNELSPTIDTRFDTPSNGTNSHPELHRAITPREAARLQSFPDDFVFLGKKTEITKQIGNAVPPLMARAIGESINEQIEDL